MGKPMREEAPGREGTRPPRLAALAVLVALAAGLVVLMALRLRWVELAGPAAVRVAADFSAPEVARARSFHAATRPLSYGSLALGLLVLAVLGLTPAGARVVAAVARPVGGHWVWRVVLGALAVSFLHRALLLPLGVRSEVVSRQYGLSTQSWLGWTADVAKSLALESGLLVAAFLALYVLVRRLPRLWWVPAAAGAGLLVVLVSFVYPVVVEPVFNSFRPMQRQELRESLLRLAERDGVPVREVLVADASRRTTAVNAYVSGFGSTRRLVVYDTLLRSSTPREVRLVVAHELGHTRQRDVLYGTAAGALGAAAGVCLVFVLTSWPALTRRAGATRVGDPRSLALLLLLFSTLSTAALPAQNLLSRQVEARADVHALDLTRDPLGYARMQRQLALRNVTTLRPGVVGYYLYASHPTPPQRIALAREWARTHQQPVPPPLG